MSLQQILQKNREEFDEEFVYWVVLGSTLNDGSERRWKKVGQNPQEILDWYTKSIKELLYSLYEGENTHREEQLSFSSDAIFDRGYNQAKQDTLNRLKSIIDSL